MCFFLFTFISFSVIIFKKQKTDKALKGCDFCFISTHTHTRVCHHAAILCVYKSFCVTNNAFFSFLLFLLSLCTNIKKYNKHFNRIKCVCMCVFPPLSFPISLSLLKEAHMTPPPFSPPLSRCIDPSDQPTLLTAGKKVPDGGGDSILLLLKNNRRLRVLLVVVFVVVRVLVLG